MLALALTLGRPGAAGARPARARRPAGGASASSPTHGLRGLRRLHGRRLHRAARDAPALPRVLRWRRRPVRRRSACCSASAFTEPGSLPQRDVAADAVPRLRARRGSRWPASTPCTRAGRSSSCSSSTPSLCVVSFVTPGSPLGNNIGRFFMVFGLPLLVLLRHRGCRRPFPYGDLADRPRRPRSGCCRSARRSATSRARGERPQTRASFFAPALPRRAQRYYDPDYRIHVVALRRHWEACTSRRPATHHARLVPAGGRHPQRPLLHRATTRPRTSAWLRRMGVQYVFLPDAPLDPWSKREARILRDLAGLRAGGRGPAPGPSTACATREPLRRRAGRRHRATSPTSVTAARLRGATGRATYLLKVTWSPVLEAERRAGRARRRSARPTASCI